MIIIKFIFITIVLNLDWKIGIFWTSAKTFAELNNKNAGELL